MVSSVFFVLGEEEEFACVVKDDVHVDVAPVVDDLRSDIGFLMLDGVVGAAPDIDIRLDDEGFFLGEDDMVTPFCFSCSCNYSLSILVD